MGSSFFESLIFNLLISHTGSVYRAIETNKRGLEYNKFIGIYYILFTSYILINSFNKIFKTYALIYLFITTQSFLKRTVLYLLGYGIAIHLVELYIFYISSVIIQSDLAIKSVLILFALNFILDRIPLISNIPDINEILFPSINNTSSVLILRL